jgi:carboxymethylenebutenolidase
MSSSFVREIVRTSGSFTGLLSYPERAVAPLPAVVVIQEAWGLDEHIEDVVGRVARAGYVAFAPDLLSVDGVRGEVVTHERIREVKAFIDTVPLEKRDPAGIAAARELLEPAPRERVKATMEAVFGQLGRLDSFAPALLAATAFVRGLPKSRGQKVASIGFCMGGALSARLAAADPELAGAIVCYGASPPAEQAAKIRCPVLGFYAANDERINSGIPAFAEVLAASGVPYERHMHERARHAYFNDTRSAYDADAARALWARALGFLHERLA